MDTLHANYAKCLACPKRVGGICTAHVVRPPAASVAMAGKCPMGLFDGQPSASPRDPGVAPEVWGPKAWKVLHSQRNPTPEWFQGWLSEIPSMGCTCKKNFAEILRMWPPDFSSDEAFFISGHRWHCLVSTTLGKPVISLTDAKRLYSR